MSRPKIQLSDVKRQAQRMQQQIAQQRINWKNREGFVPKELKKTITLKVPDRYQNNPEAQKVYYQKQIQKMQHIKDSYYYNPKQYYKVEKRMVENLGGEVEYKTKKGKRKKTPVYYVTDEEGNRKKVNRNKLSKILTAWHRICENKDYNYNADIYPDLLLESTKQQYNNMSIDKIEMILYEKMKGLQNHAREYEDIEQQDDGLDIPF